MFVTMEATAGCSLVVASMKCKSTTSSGQMIAFGVVTLLQFYDAETN